MPFAWYYLSKTHKAKPGAVRGIEPSPAVISGLQLKSPCWNTINSLKANTKSISQPHLLPVKKDNDYQIYCILSQTQSRLLRREWEWEWECLIRRQEVCLKKATEKQVFDLKGGMTQKGRGEAAGANQNLHVATGGQSSRLLHIGGWRGSNGQAAVVTRWEVAATCCQRFLILPQFIFQVLPPHPRGFQQPAAPASHNRPGSHIRFTLHVPCNPYVETTLVQCHQYAVKSARIAAARG